MVEYYVHRYGGRFIDNSYGAGSGQIWFEEVRCSGTETHITYCQHNGWAVHKCRHDDDVSVLCIPGELVSRFLTAHQTQTSWLDLKGPTSKEGTEGAEWKGKNEQEGDGTEFSKEGWREGRKGGGQ